jgi:energy-coupling factor transporter ATP-binding protein EcfA2
MLEAVAVSLRRGGFRLEVPRFRATPGELVAVAGRNGSGKSTFLLALAGILHPAAGEIRLAGGPCLPPEVAFLPARAEDIVLGARRLLEVSVTLGLQGQTDLEPEAVLRRIEGLLDLPREDLEDAAEPVYRALCGLLATGARCLVLDEPTASLGPRAQAVLRRTFMRLRGQGHIVIVATHDPELARLADRWYRTERGELLEDSLDAAITDHVLKAPALWPAFGGQPVDDVLRGIWAT